MDSFQIRHSSSLAWEGVSHTIWSWPISSRSYSHDLCHLGDLTFLRFVPTWYLYAFMNKLEIRLWMDGLNLNVILMFLPIWFCHMAAIASMWQPVLEPINSVTNTWLSFFATCDWLRTLVHLHCDVMITTSTTKTWWSCWSLGVDLPCLRKKICHQKTTWMRWKYVNLKMKT